MFVVRWKRVAHDQLAELWMASADRSALTESINEAERALAANPLEQGESRSGSTRILFTSHVGVVYDVQERLKSVEILRVLMLRGN